MSNAIFHYRMKNLDTILEALLFVKTEPISKKKIAEILKAEETEVDEAVAALKEKLSGRGIRLVQIGDSVVLGTAPEASETIESLFKEELERDLGRAGLETISIILYKAPVPKSEIDFIRGVNSQFILRNLLIRGLVERIPSSSGRGGAYRPTLDLLRYLGVTKVEELPDYESATAAIKNYKASMDEELAEDKQENA